MQVGLRVLHGAALTTCASDDNPARTAYLDYLQGPFRARFSWDPLTTMVAVRGIAGVPPIAACTQCDGVNVIDAGSGNNEWVLGGRSHQTYLVLRNGTAAGEAIDALLCQPPARSATVIDE